MGMPDVFALVGRFSGPETVYRSPFTQERAAMGTWSIRKAVGDRYLVLEYIEEAGGRVVMRGHGIIGYDDDADVYTLHWFDSSGHPPRRPGRGEWDGHALEFESADDEGHAWRTIFAVDGGNLIFRAETAGNPLVEGSYLRRDAAEAFLST